MSNLEQLKAEAEAARLALEQAERAERERVAEEKLEVERAAYAEKQKAHAQKMEELLSPIFHALCDAEIVCELQRDDQRGSAAIETPGNSDTHIAIEAEVHHGGRYSWHSTPTGRYVVTVGGRYQDLPRLRYPQRQGGGFNVKKIVASVKERIASRAAERKRESDVGIAKAEALSFAEALRQQLRVSPANVGRVTGVHEVGKFDSRGRYQHTSTVAPRGKVFVNVGTPLLNVEQTQILLQALDEIDQLKIADEKK